MISINWEQFINYLLMVGERYKLIKRNPKIEAPKNKKKKWNSAIDNHKEVVEVEGNENIHNINFFWFAS